jgi:RNA polymerase sigma-70 factor, ECF subfamily
MRNLLEQLRIAKAAGLDEEERKKVFTLIWDRYGRRIACFIAQIVPAEYPHHDDLFQEVMMRIFENLGRYDPLRSFEAWAFRIARNRCIDHLRTRRSHEALGEGISDTRDDPGAIAVRSEMDRAIMRSLAALEPGDRQIAYLKYFEELRNGAIAEVMEMNISTVKTRITAIRRRLRPALEEWL